MLAERHAVDETLMQLLFSFDQDTKVDEKYKANFNIPSLSRYYDISGIAKLPGKTLVR